MMYKKMLQILLHVGTTNEDVGNVFMRKEHNLKKRTSTTTYSLVPWDTLLILRYVLKADSKSKQRQIQSQNKYKQKLKHSLNLKRISNPLRPHEQQLSLDTLLPQQLHKFDMTRLIERNNPIRPLLRNDHVVRSPANEKTPPAVE